MDRAQCWFLSVAIPKGSRPFGLLPESDKSGFFEKEMGRFKRE
jgi:hypothetical protein